MRLSRTELRLLGQIQKKDLSSAIKKSSSQVYRCKKHLQEEGILDKSFQPEDKTHVKMLLRLISDYPNLIDPFSGSGISIFAAMTEPRTVEEIQALTGLKRTVIFKKLSEARQISLISKNNINDRIWPELKEFLSELKKYEEISDSRVPSGSVIYFRNNKEVVFSADKAVDAVLTGFSAYAKFGIKILSKAHDYCLPKKKLSKKEIFIHSLYIAEKDRSVRNLTYITLFYLKHKKDLCNVKHRILADILSVIKGDRLPGYPTLDEIKEKGEIYDIRV